MVEKNNFTGSSTKIERSLNEDYAGYFARLNTPISHCINSIIREALKNDCTLEFSLGLIKDIFLRNRIDFGYKQAVVFTKLSAFFFFERGFLHNTTYKKMIKVSEKYNCQKYKDFISIHGTVRKKTSKNAPVYEKKYRTDICYIHFPGHDFDICVSCCRSEIVENPDRNNKIYKFPLRREKIFFKIDYLNFCITEYNAELDNNQHMVKKNKTYYEAKVKVIGDQNYDYFDILNKISEINFQIKN